MNQWVWGVLLSCFTVFAVGASHPMGLGAIPPNCSSLTNQAFGPDPATGNLNAIGVDNLTFTIELTDYASYITQALDGKPLNDLNGGLIALPACIAPTQTNQWMPIEGSSCMKVNFEATEVDSSRYPSITPGHAFVLQLSGSSYELAASYGDSYGGNGYCPCGTFTGSNPTCNGQAPWPVMKLALNSNFIEKYNILGDQSGNDLGYCAKAYGSSTGEGGFYINIFAPLGTIPATGIYKGTFTINAMEVSCP